MHEQFDKHKAKADYSGPKLTSLVQNRASP